MPIQDNSVTVKVTYTDGTVDIQVPYLADDGISYYGIEENKPIESVQILGLPPVVLHEITEEEMAKYEEITPWLSG